MGIAAYNRGSRSISRQIDEEMKAAYVAVEHPPSEQAKPKEKGVLGYWNLCDDPVPVKAGDKVYCTVSQCRGWSTVIGVKGPWNDLRIKTDLHNRTWAYAHNFTKEPPQWMLK